uniref:Putative 50 kDa protein in type I retrotransposable element R1DM n=1 Tax=Lygus hesperus TaxID=30085 RepID=A0A0A9XB35_LYGHE
MEGSSTSGADVSDYTRLIVEEVSYNEQELIKYCLNSDNKIGKKETATITTFIKQIVKRVHDLALKLNLTHGAYVEANKSRDKICDSLEANTLTILDLLSKNETNHQGNKSYAQTLKSKAVKKTLHSDNSVVVYPTDKTTTKNPEVIKQEMKAVFNPVAEGVKITAVRNLGEKGLLIRAAGKEDLNAIMANKTLKSIGLTVSRPMKRLPRLALFGVPSEITEDEIRESLIKLNNMEEREIMDQMKIGFKFGRKGGLTMNLTIEVSPELRNKLLNLKKVYLGWSCCRIEDFVRISRCYRCCGFNHVQKSCKAPTPTCAHCAGSHDTSTCEKKHPPTCTNCKKFHLAHDHAASDLNCPSYINALQGLINRTEYGN